MDYLPNFQSTRIRYNLVNSFAPPKNSFFSVDSRKIKFIALENIADRDIWLVSGYRSSLRFVRWFRVCVLETDSEIGVEKISLANDSVTKSLDLICLAMFHTRLLRIRSHLLCNVNLCLVITLKSFQAYWSLAFSCRRNQLEVHLDQMLISSYYLSTAFSIDPAIKYFGSLVLFLCVNKHILNASFWTL